MTPFGALRELCMSGGDGGDMLDHVHNSSTGIGPCTGGNKTHGSLLILKSAGRSGSKQHIHICCRYNPCGQSRLREIFIKQDNLLHGRFLAEVTQEVGVGRGERAHVGRRGGTCGMGRGASDM